MQVEHVKLESAVVVLTLGADGAEYAVQALAHLLCIYVGLGVRNHADARRTGGPRLIVDLIEIRVSRRLGKLIHTVSGVHHFPVEIAPRLRGLLLSALADLDCVIRDHVLRLSDAVLPAGKEIALIGKHLGDFVQILAGHLLRRTFGRCFLLLGPPKLKVIQPIRKGIGV